ncbi:protein of unknown function [Methylococcus capsulatus]|uniref:Uncharacterized protein n=1 Tax=Methylococcus capsulatus TaxID=414 RepID=A0AA35UC84_METCP|nr:protein of unknown function [Methylococcus capsulatus]
MGCGIPDDPARPLPESTAKAPDWERKREHREAAFTSKDHWQAHGGAGSTYNHPIHRPPRTKSGMIA